MKTYCDAVDELAAIRAKIAELRDCEASLREVIESMADDSGKAYGKLFVASISTSARRSTDWKAIASHFEPSSQLVTAHTKRTPVTTLRLSSFPSC